ncbi:MAG: hydrogenase [Epsilonproteobacteria bacterium]|nr:hydrogenase [Campylobacterota bacterium]NPA64316.1 hydrogenase [Campylobacterota bacterium]
MSTKILLLCDTFNSLTQRIFCYLQDRGYEVSVEYALSPQTMREGAELFEPDLIIAPYLTKKVPKEVYKRYPTFILHPGPFGDRGAWALDNAILNEEPIWGVSLIEAVEEMDGGPIWGSEEFAMPKASKGAIYRTIVSDLALKLIAELLQNLDKAPLPNSLLPPHPPITQRRRRIDWQKDRTKEIITKINASDNYPGVKDSFFGMELFLFGAVEEREGLEKIEAKPKEIIAKRDGAVLVKTIDGAVWIRQMTRIEDGVRQIKLPSTYVLKSNIKGVKERRILLYVEPSLETFKEITYYQKGRVGFLGFDFYNGAMSSDHCIRLKYAVETLKDKVDILVLLGGEQFFSNGIHLSILEDSKKQGEDGWSNINAMNDLVRTILFSEDILAITAFRANAGAGGVFLGLAADIVAARKGVVLNPHYKTLGLSGSEFHTYTLPRRVGEEMARKLLDEALPISAEKAKEIGMVDRLFNDLSEVEAFALELVEDEDRYYDLLDAKRDRLEADEERIEKLLQAELTKMYPQFWDESSPFHELRRQFVYKICPAQTPKRLAKHRREDA